MLDARNIRLWVLWYFVEFGLLSFWKCLDPCGLSELLLVRDVCARKCSLNMCSETVNEPAEAKKRSGAWQSMKV